MMKKSQQWIDAPEGGTPFTVGEAGFLLRVTHADYEFPVLGNVPGHDAETGEWKLTGDCEAKNPDEKVEALGLFRVLRVAKNGRAMISQITDANEIDEELETLGYPDLSPANDYTTALDLIECIIATIGAERCDADQAAMVLNNLLIEGEICFNMDAGLRFKEGTDPQACILEYAQWTLFGDEAHDCPVCIGAAS